LTPATGAIIGIVVSVSISHQAAEVTGATAFYAPTAQDLSAVYDNLQSRIRTTQETQEITAWFAAAALVLVVLGAGLSAVWFGRRP